MTTSDEKGGYKIVPNSLQDRYPYSLVSPDGVVELMTPREISLDELATRLSGAYTEGVQSQSTTIAELRAKLSEYEAANCTFKHENRELRAQVEGLRERVKCEAAEVDAWRRHCGPLSLPDKATLAAVISAHEATSAARLAAKGEK